MSLPDDRYPPVKFTTREVPTQKIAMASRVSRQFLMDPKIDHVEEHVTDALWVRLSGYVFGEAMDAEAEVVEEPIWPSWKHQLVASLPEGFVRRWLTYFWGFDDNKLAIRRRHKIHVHAHCVFPDAEIVVPQSQLGRPYRFASVEPIGYIEEPVR